jgi:hypothetical protein
LLLLPVAAADSVEGGFLVAGGTPTPMRALASEKDKEVEL